MSAAPADRGGPDAGQGRGGPRPGEDRPLRIIQAAAFAFPSPQGSQVFVRGMARALARRGHEVTVLCYGHGLGAPDPEYRVLRTPSLPGYQRVRAGPDAVKPLLDLALAALLAREPADVVHAHNYEAPLAALLARPWQRAPLVYSAHNTMGEELPTYFEGERRRRLARWAGQLLDHAIPRMADHAIAISAPAVETLRALGCARVSLVPPGIKPEDVAPAVPALLPPGPWVVYAGNPDRYQDLDVLLAAMAQVPQARLLLVSASPLDEWARQAPPGTRCVLTRSFEEVRSLLAASTLAVVPRSVCSGYPIKLLNSLGMGLPTVIARGSAQGLPGEVVVPDRDPVAMAAAIRALLAEPERRAQLGAEAREHVLAHCTWAARAADLELLYRTLLEPAQRFAAASDRMTL